KRLGNAAACAPLYEKAGDEETKVGHANALGGFLQRVFQLDADADLTQHPFEFCSHGPANLTHHLFKCCPHGPATITRCGLDGLEDRQAGSDCADDEIERVRERVEEL